MRKATLFVESDDPNFFSIEPHSSFVAFFVSQNQWDVNSTEKSCSSRAKALLMIEVDTSNFDKVRYGLERIQVSRVYRLFVSNRGTG